MFAVYGHIGTVAAILLALRILLAAPPLLPNHFLTAMAIMIVARIGVIFIPTAIDGTGTWQGKVHLLLAIVTFAAAYSAIAQGTPPLAAHAWPVLSLILHMLRFITMLALTMVVITMFAPLKRFFGLFERVFLLCTLLWFFAAGIALITMPSP